MKHQTKAIYIVTLCVIVSMGYFNATIINIQSTNVSSNHNQFDDYQFKQNDYQQHNIVTKTNGKLVNNQSVQKLSRKQSIKPFKKSSFSTGFISLWQTDITSFSNNNITQIKLPLVSNGNYDFYVSWGDGSTNLITAYNQSAVTHAYNTPGTYRVNITGTIIGWSFNGSDEALKLIQISNWGSLRLGNDGYYFSGASNLVLTATDALNLNGTTNLAGMFENCYSLGNTGNLNSWNVSQVTNMTNMFKIDNYNNILSNFNLSLASWDVSKVTDMSGMFEGSSLNQSLNSWNVSNVTDMSYMFAGAKYSQPLNSWDVSKVTDMSYMFNYASSFDKPLNSWNVSQVIDMSHLFYASGFNQPLNTWNVSKVTDMSDIFYSTSFNQPLNSWDVSKLTDMSSMFLGASRFNQPLNSWNVSQVTDMNSMFLGASSFNQPLNSWNVSQVTDMTDMFNGATSFNQPLNLWNVSNVRYMSGMFSLAFNFNQPLNSWYVVHVFDMSDMFFNATSFNQPLGSWDISGVKHMTGMFQNDSLSNSNYDNLLLGWSTLPYLQHNVVFNAGNSQYSSSAQNARDILIKNFGWTITDGGLASSNLIYVNLFITLIVVFVIVILAYFAISYFEYKKNGTKEHKKDFNFLIYLKNTLIFKRYKPVVKETLSSKTFDKIEQIIDENKEN